MFAFLNKVIISLLKIYKLFLSPMLGPRCRFHPSCSLYAEECFLKFSFFTALWYSGKRILKCHPFHEGGIDHIP